MTQTQNNRIHDGPSNASVCVLLAHGSGAGMDSPALQTIAHGLAKAGFKVVRFEFPYMQTIRKTGKRRPPDRAPILLEHFREEIRACGHQPDQIVLAGRSMGGRMASMIADEFEVMALVCLGYPFHPPRKPDKLRTEHLEDLATPTLVLQGERDDFGNVDEVAGYRLSKSIAVTWVPDGDHGFKPRKSSGHTEQGNLDFAVGKFVEFVNAISP